MGPLAGLRIVEMAGLGPGPFCAMMLADNGADVVRIGRMAKSQASPAPFPKDILNRSRKSISVDLKSPAGIEIVRRLSRKADGLIEGYRPGVMERLGLGPDVLLGDNPRLVYGRMTGWGQSGPYSRMAGHDINFISLSGALGAIGRAGQAPVPPLNLVGDFGGGGLVLAFGMISAIFHAQRTGVGQVIDCAMTEGSAALMTAIYSMRAHGQWRDDRGVNPLDGAAPFYDTYETSDGNYISLGAVEPQFYDEMLRLIGLHGHPLAADQHDEASWPGLKALIQKVMLTKTRAEWCSILEETNACFAPVMSMAEAPSHIHNEARGAFIELEGVIQPAPVPRYSVTSNDLPTPMDEAGTTAAALLREAGYSETDIAQLRRDAVID